MSAVSTFELNGFQVQFSIQNIRFFAKAIKLRDCWLVHLPKVLLKYRPFVSRFSIV
ncbi:hypothetical protein MITS9508_01721 [Synechococcus sp. MIT S9508]|nr:hypothetical protein MITS9508_01721 [Synechococcus sp. MIT S9508]